MAVELVDQISPPSQILPSQAIVPNPETSSAVPIDRLLFIADKSRHLITSDGIIASGDGFYRFYFPRDAKIATRSLAMTAQMWQRHFVDPTLLKSAAKAGLRHVNQDGWLPHEVGTKEQGFPFEVDPETGIGKHFGSIDENGWALLALSEMYELFPADRDFFEETIEPFRLMARWAIKNVRKHRGMIGHSFRESTGPFKGSEHGTWQDGQGSIKLDNGKPPKFPMYYALEQALYATALAKAGDALAPIDLATSRHARIASRRLKVNFNRGFVFNEEPWGLGLARAIDGKGQKIHAGNIDILIALGFIYNKQTILSPENEKLLMPIVRKLLTDLTASSGLLRTQSLESKGNGYHGPNTIWPMANVLSVKALENIRTLPFIQKDPNASSELHNHALTTAKGVARLILECDNPVEVRTETDGKFRPYTETRPDGTQFVSSEVQTWTACELAWLVPYLKANGVKEITL